MKSARARSILFPTFDSTQGGPRGVEVYAARKNVGRLV